MSSMTAESRVDQHSIQSVDLRIPLGLRHEGPQVQELWIFHILETRKQQINTNLSQNPYFINTTKTQLFSLRCVIVNKIVCMCHCTFVILPPEKCAKRLSGRVSTLALRWMVNLFEAVTIFLHLGSTNVEFEDIVTGCFSLSLLNYLPVKELTWCICRRFLHPAVLV